jgi:hypothetical protein
MPGDNLSESAAADLVRATPMPVSFNGSETLFAFNLFAMTAFTCFGAWVLGWMVTSLYRHRRDARWNDPVTVYRVGWLFASVALTIRCGAEAGSLWSWDPATATTSARFMLLKRYLDPLGVAFGGAWMLLLILSYRGMTKHLRQEPFPVHMWARRSALIRPAVVIVLCFAAAFGVVWTKG